MNPSEGSTLQRWSLRGVTNQPQKRRPPKVRTGCGRRRQQAADLLRTGRTNYFIAKTVWRDSQRPPTCWARVVTLERTRCRESIYNHSPSRPPWTGGEGPDELGTWWFPENGVIAMLRTYDVTVLESGERVTYEVEAHNKPAAMKQAKAKADALLPMVKEVEVA